MTEYINNGIINISNNIRDGIIEAFSLSKKYKKNILFSYTYRIDTDDFLPFVTHPSDRQNLRFYWQQPSKGISLAGLNSIWVRDYSKKDFYSEVKKETVELFKNSVSIADSKLVGPKIIGGHAFTVDAKSDNTWKNFPRSRFFLPECLATLNDDGAWLTISKFVNFKNSSSQFYNDLMQLCIHYQNRMPVTLPSVTKVDVDNFTDIPSKKDWNKTLCSVLEKIRPGEVEKVVISRSHQIKVSDDFSVSSALQILRNSYPKCTTFMFSFPSQGIFFGSSPERLIRMKNDFIETEALAGTQARGENMEEDRLLSKTLINSHKENEEHRLVVDQILRKLKPVVKDLDFNNNPIVLKLTNVQHLQTPISGRLKNNDHILDLVNTLHPTPAIAGTPTEKAIKIINNEEKTDWGWCSGPIGWFDKNGDGEFNVALRSALVKKGTAYIFVGCGIVSESIPQKEWDETELKLHPILSALSGGQF